MFYIIKGQIKPKKTIKNNKTIVESLRNILQPVENVKVLETLKQSWNILILANIRSLDFIWLET